MVPPWVGVWRERLSAPPLSGGSSSEGTVGDLWKIPPSVPHGRRGDWGRRPGGQALRLHTGEADGLPAPGLQGGSLAFRVALPAGQSHMGTATAASRQQGSRKLSALLRALRVGLCLPPGHSAPRTLPLPLSLLPGTPNAWGQ